MIQNVRKMFQNGLQIRTKSRFGVPDSDQNGAVGVQNGVQVGPRRVWALHMGSRGSQDRLQSLQESKKTPQRAPKWSQNGPKSESKTRTKTYQNSNQFLRRFFIDLCPFQGSKIESFWREKPLTRRI